MTDREFARCMAQIASGDKEGLHQVYVAYGKLIYAVIFDLLHRREETEDMTSEFFLKLYRIASTYQSGRGHVKWMVTIVRNMTVDEIRKRSRETMVEEIERVMPVQTEPDMAETISQRMTLEEAMKMLHPKEKEIIDLKVLGGFTYREIAEMLGEPMGTVTWRYQEGIKKLRRCRDEL